MPEEYRRRFILSSLWDDSEDVAPALDGIIFLKKIFELTKTRADPKAHSRPIMFDADTSNEQANITPIVRGKSEMYVLLE